MWCSLPGARACAAIQHSKTSVCRLNASLPQCLQGLREELVDGNYSLVLEFANKKGMSSEQWEVWRPKFGTFFGPGITAQACGNRCLCSVWPEFTRH